MKFLATIAILAVGANAAAIAEPWCTKPGQGCWKREAMPAPTGKSPESSDIVKPARPLGEPVFVSEPAPTSSLFPCFSIC